MKLSSRLWRRLGLGLVGVLILVSIAAVWIVPAVIKGQLHARYAGRVTFGGWWLGLNSAGVRDLALNEGPDADSPVWARAARVETDLTLGGALRGRFAPGRITLVRPRITFRLGPDGQPLTRPPLKSGGGSSAVPEVLMKDGRITIRQEGRPEMVVGPVEARLSSDGHSSEVLQAETDDPTWGKWKAVGDF